MGIGERLNYLGHFWTASAILVLRACPSSHGISPQFLNPRFFSGRITDTLERLEIAFLGHADILLHKCLVAFLQTTTIVITDCYIVKRCKNQSVQKWRSGCSHVIFPVWLYDASCYHPLLNSSFAWLGSASILMAKH